MKIEIFDYGYEIMPTRAHRKDAGLDIYAIKPVIIKPGETVPIPVGFGIDVPNGMMAVMMPRSSLSLKGLLVSQSPIDAGYKGEVHVIMTNASNIEYGIAPKTKIAQLVFIPIQMPLLVNDYEEIERNLGKFGSTGI